MKERPIIFAGDSVRAILAGRKTQTRRVMKPQPQVISDRIGDLLDWRNGAEPGSRGFRNVTASAKFPESFARGMASLASPYASGDALWVREAFTVTDGHPGLYTDHVLYRADADDASLAEEKRIRRECRELSAAFPEGRWRSPIHMPRWASRLTLEIVSVRVERLQDITEENAKAEGVQEDGSVCNSRLGQNGALGIPIVPHQHLDAVARFACGWDVLNFKRGFGWDVNPFIWRIEFRSTQEGE